jgi:tRNA A-37 threonylcarbamoyl transferase component Bud32
MSLTNCIIVEAPAATLWCDPIIPESLRKNIVRGPWRFIQAAAALPVKISPETLVLQANLPVGGRPLAVAVKQYIPRSLWKELAAWFRPSKAGENWEKAEFLRARGIATPRPLLACRTRGWRMVHSSFLVTEWITGGENLHLYGWRLGKQAADVRLRIAAACAEDLGRLLGRMHAAGATHRDLKAANLLVVEGQASVSTWLVDLDGLQMGRRMDLARQARDLGRLAAGLAAHPWVTRSICRRFLRAYAGQFPQQNVDWKPLWRATAARAAEIAHRKQSCGEEVL